MLVSYALMNYLYSPYMFDDNKIRMARKPGKKQKENPVRWCNVPGNIKDKKEM